MVFQLLQSKKALNKHRTVKKIMFGQRRDHLDFCWDMAEVVMRHKLDAAAVNCGADEALGVAVLRRADLLAWLHEKARMEIPDLNEAWCSGFPLVALVDALCPNELPLDEARAAEDAGRRVDMCLEVAERVLKVPRIMKAEHVTDGHEKVLLLYLVELVHAAGKRGGTEVGR